MTTANDNSSALRPGFCLLLSLTCAIGTLIAVGGPMREPAYQDRPAPSPYPRIPLALHGAPSWSPDDGMIAYSSFLTELPWLYAPPAGRVRRPALVWVHGGAPGQGAAEPCFDAALQYFVSKGFVVVAPNYRGSVGDGAAVADLYGIDEVVGDLAGAGNYLRTLPSVDPRRVGIIGFSGGGYFALLATANAPGAFAACADFAGLVDPLELHKSSPEFRPALERSLGDASTQAERYRAATPLSVADRIGSPVLIVHSADEIGGPAARFSNAPGCEWRQDPDVVHQLLRACARSDMRPASWRLRQARGR
jgi:dienelactone hydrolase